MSSQPPVAPNSSSSFALVQSLVSFLEHESDPTIVLDPDYNILAANTAYQR
jgi:PAS domain-containing protein